MTRKQENDFIITSSLALGVNQSGELLEEIVLRNFIVSKILSSSKNIGLDQISSEFLFTATLCGTTAITNCPILPVGLLLVILPLVTCKHI